MNGCVKTLRRGRRWPGRATVAALAVAAAALWSPATARAADIGLHGVGVEGGFVAPSGWDTGYALGVSVDLGEVVNKVRIVPTLQYWKATNTISFFGADIDLSLTNLALGADVLWYPSGERRGWFVGGGAHLNRLDFDVAGGSVSSTRLGPNGVGGYEFDLGGMSAFVAGRYHLVSGFETVQVTFGVRFGE